MVFLDSNWGHLGTRSELEQIISERTGIHRSLLSGNDKLELFSVAQRMSWAAQRETERIEDRAYFLMGIFGINMPLLYGEREKVFFRLREEILRVSDNRSLFAWKSKDGEGHSSLSLSNNPPNLSSRGVYLEAHFMGMDDGIGLVILDCQQKDGRDKLMAICVLDVYFAQGKFSSIMQQFARIWMTELKELDLKTLRKTQYPIRRICVQSGRSISNLSDFNPTDTTNLSQGLSNSSDVLSIMDIEASEGLIHTLDTPLLGLLWLLLTRQDVERKLQTEHHPSLPLSLVRQNSPISLQNITMLISRGVTLDSEGWNNVMRAAIDIGNLDMIRFDT